jgi:two-component system, LytTR family, response regulator
MKLGLICSDNTRFILAELFAARNITIEPQSNVYIVESGCEIPADKIAILFSLANISQLIELLDRLKVNDDGIDNIVGKSNDDCYAIISYKQVCYFEARGNSVFCITAGNEYRVKERLYELEDRLPRNRFIRVGKSFIVNIGNVKEIIPWFGRRLLLRFFNSKNEIEVSKSYVKNVKEFLGM